MTKINANTGTSNIIGCTEKGLFQQKSLQATENPNQKYLAKKKKKRGAEFTDSQNGSVEVRPASGLTMGILKAQKFSGLFPPKCVTFTLVLAPQC